MALQLSVPLNETEKWMLKDLFQSNLEQVYFEQFDTASLLQSGEEHGFSQPQLEDGLQCLIDRGLIEGTVYFGGALPPYIRFTESGFQDVCEIEVQNYDKQHEAVAKHLAQLSNEKDNEETVSVKGIAQALEMPFLVTLHFIRSFVSIGWVKIQREGGDMAFVSYVSPLFNRALEEE